VIGMVLSADPVRDPSTLAIVGAGASLAISDIPFDTCWRRCAWAMVNGVLVANPTYEETKASKVNIVVAGTDEGIVMVESGAQQVSEADVLAAIEFGHDCCKKIAAGIRALMKKCGKAKKEYVAPAVNKALYDQIAASVQVELKDAMNTEKYEKLDSYSKVDRARRRPLGSYPKSSSRGQELFDALKERIFRDEMLKAKRRPDGESSIRSARSKCEVGCCRALTVRHCSRARDAALVTADARTKDANSGLSCWMRRSRRSASCCTTISRRSAWAKWASCAARDDVRSDTGRLRNALSRRWFPRRCLPYTMRIVSDILESNGSSSMASVVRRDLVADGRGRADYGSVAGIAMGLVMEGKDYAVLTDIAGAEDHYGDMDFKVAAPRGHYGAADGYQGAERDPRDPQGSAGTGAQGALAHSGDHGGDDRQAARHHVAVRAAHLHMKIPTDKIRELIGPGGKMIRSIVEQTGCKIDVEDDGSVKIFSSDGTAATAVSR